MIGGVVVGAGPANKMIIWESVITGHSPAMNKMACDLSFGHPK